MSRSTSKLIFLLFLPVLTAEKCTGSKNGNLKRNSSAIVASKTEAVSDAIPLTDVATPQPQLDGQKEENNGKPIVEPKIKATIPSIQESKNRETTQKDQSGEGEHLFTTKEDKQSIDLSNKENLSELDDNDISSTKGSKENKKPIKILGISIPFTNRKK
ncbi:hypothetical protein [Candidatus Cardinium hertigii]|uniref:hypothetical protein n=1 Tax=Candidatus Cardinium hertigii TaxID=247481 RepID=UPI003D7D9499